MESREIYEQVAATKRATVCIDELVDMVLSEEEEEDDEEDILVKIHTIMVSLLKCAGAFQPIGLQPPEARGAIAEMMCKYMVNRWLEVRGIKGEVINGVLIPVYPNSEGRDDTTEIDITVVTDRVIFIIECKSFSGNKTTDGKYLSTKNINKQPWDQNQGHVVAFKNNAKKHFRDIALPKIYNIVYVFAKGYFVEWSFPMESDRVLLINLGAFATLDNLYNESDKTLSKKDMDRIIAFLKDNEPDVEQQTEHVMRIKSFL